VNASFELEKTFPDLLPFDGLLFSKTLNINCKFSSKQVSLEILQPYVFDKTEKYQTMTTI